MIDFDSIKNILTVAIGASVISTALIQKIKESIKKKKELPIIACIFSILVGFSFSITFSELNYVDSLWVGICTYIGADALYKTFEDKLFKPFSSMEKKEIVGEIKTEE